MAAREAVEEPVDGKRTGIWFLDNVLAGAFQRPDLSREVCDDSVLLVLACGEEVAVVVLAEKAIEREQCVGAV